MKLIARASQYRTSSPLLGRMFFGAGVGFGLLSIYNFAMSYSAEGEISYRKEQLSKPIYKLSEEELINPPWNKGNLHEWLYRRVEVSGRPIHRNAMLVPRQLSGTPGYQYVVPLLVRENKDRSNQQGLILSKGWIQASLKEPSNRWRIENIEKQTFVGFVSTLPQLKNHSLTEGNVTSKFKKEFTCSDMDDFAEGTGFVNKDQISTALVERLEETGVLNERSASRYSIDCSHADVYPYRKTEAGALQLPDMPWDYRNSSSRYLLSSLFSLFIGASLF